VAAARLRHRRAASRHQAAKAAARCGAEISIVIDLIHVLEYIWKAAWSLHDAGDPAAEDWVAAKRSRCRPATAPGRRRRSPPRRARTAPKPSSPSAQSSTGEAVTETETGRTGMTGVPAHLAFTLQAAREG
jgi:hypothetical protein